MSYLSNEPLMGLFSGVIDVSQIFPQKSRLFPTKDKSFPGVEVCRGGV